MQLVTKLLVPEGTTLVVALKEQVTELKSKNNSREVILSKNRLRDTGQLIPLNAKKPAENNDMENGNNCLLNSTQSRASETF